MSQPSIPNITPLISISKDQTISLLLSSIAMDELALSHLINAEAEEMQAFVHHVGRKHHVHCREFIQFNDSVSQFMEGITMKQWIALKRLDRLIALTEDCSPYNNEPPIDKGDFIDEEFDDDCL
ncbi:hypothetical protein ACFPVX_16895 [Cohnella faecalis]|uniref:Uncharacterized protein n=1 Tax=Cohnella faecalis TaxID=2315694 RepID=A0A398CU26_9BACL|nr:hypothetical protein [Cohnella faecalis]RIE02821.1 hypothetical protein D3H35_19505 [Cohnella faecalis]